MRVNSTSTYNNFDYSSEQSASAKKSNLDYGAGTIYYHYEIQAAIQKLSDRQKRELNQVIATAQARANAGGGGGRAILAVNQARVDFLVKVGALVY